MEDKTPLDKVTIKFPRHITTREAEVMLRYVAENLSSRITYGSETHIQLENTPQGMVMHKYVRNIRGMMVHPNNAEMMNFFLARDPRNPRKYSEFIFNLSLGEELFRVSPNNQDLMDAVFVEIGRYFRK